MNQELFQLYIEYLAQGKISTSGLFLSVQFGEVLRIVKLEPKRLNSSHKDRTELPEFQVALTIFNSPLVKALA